MLYAETIHGSKGLEDQYLVREKVFVIEQNIDRNIERDNYDKNCYHVVVYESNIPVGTGRVIYIDNTPLIGRIAVLKEYRGKQYGDLIVRKLIDHCFKHGDKRIIVHSQVSVVKFYEKIGFIAFGNIYNEAGIEHLSMYLVQENIIKNCHKKRD